MSEPAALGFRTHSGWAGVVAVAGSLRRPVVLERCRIETADTAIPGSKQPYHAAERMGAETAEMLIRRCRDSSTLLAMRAVSALVAQLKQKGHRVVGAGILFASGRPLPDLAATLQSHALIHTAEGEFFREVLVRASEHCSLHVMKVKEREVWDIAGIRRSPWLPATQSVHGVAELPYLRHCLRADGPGRIVAYSEKALFPG